MKKAKLLFVLLSGIGAGVPQIADACTRFTYEGADGNVLTGRNFDWDHGGFDSELWILPEGITRTGVAGRSVDSPFKGPNDLKWTSKYASAVMTVGGGVADGMNEKGLSVAYTLDDDATYDPIVSSKKDVSVWIAVQYVLDNFATVDEAINGMKKINYVPSALTFPNGAKYDVFMTITDASGDNAVLQWENGVGMRIYHGKGYNITANQSYAPRGKGRLNFAGMYAVRDYYRGVNNYAPTSPQYLPGTYSSEDRIARIGYSLDHVPKESDINQARKWTFTLMRSLSPSMPYAEPNVKDADDVTGWSTVADLKYKRYYVETPYALGPMYVDLSKLNLQPGAPIRKLLISRSTGIGVRQTVFPYTGDMTNNLVTTNEGNPTWNIITK